MKIIGHLHIPHQDFSKIKTTQDIDHTLPDVMIWWEASQDSDYSLAHFCQKNQIPYAVKIHNLRELLIYSNLDAKYLIASKESAPLFQSILKEYVLDSLLLCEIEKEDEIEKLALQGVDGVIFESLLTKDEIF